VGSAGALKVCTAQFSTKSRQARITAFSETQLLPQRQSIQMRFRQEPLFQRARKYAFKINTSHLLTADKPVASQRFSKERALLRFKFKIFAGVW
jgi:hypothetical protein